MNRADPPKKVAAHGAPPSLGRKRPRKAERLDAAAETENALRRCSMQAVLLHRSNSSVIANICGIYATVVAAGPSGAAAACRFRGNQVGRLSCAVRQPTPRRCGADSRGSSTAIPGRRGPSTRSDNLDAAPSTRRRRPGRLGPTSMPGFDQLQDRGGGFLDRASGYVDHRPAIPRAQPARP